jgi:hypothetical protein
MRTLSPNAAHGYWRRPLGEESPWGIARLPLIPAGAGTLTGSAIRRTSCYASEALTASARVKGTAAFRRLGGG